MKNKFKIILGALALLVVTLGITTVYFYNKQNNTESVVETKYELKEISKGVSLVDENSADHAIYQVTLNDKTHELKFDFVYIESDWNTLYDGEVDDTDNSSYGAIGFSRMVYLQTYWDDVYLTDQSHRRSQILDYDGEYENKLADTKKRTLTRKLTEDFEIEIIKGTDGKEYLLIGVNVDINYDHHHNHWKDMVLMLINDEGKVIYNFEDKITYAEEIAFEFADPDDNKLPEYLPNKYFYITPENEGSVINYLAYKWIDFNRDIFITDNKFDAFEVKVTVGNDEVKTDYVKLPE